MFQDPSSGSQQGAQFLQNVCPQQPPYEQDPHMPAAGQIGGPGQQQPQPQFTVLPTGQQYCASHNICHHQDSSVE